jgi:regulator of replication initiation timing
MHRLGLLRRAAVIALTGGLLVIVTRAQGQQANTADPQAALSQSIHELQAQIQDLRSAVSELRSEAAQYHAENAALEERLQSLQEKLSHPAQPVAIESAINPSVAGQAESQEAAPDTGSGQQKKGTTLQEQLDLLTGKIDEQYQTKVESGSKYRVRLSGIALFNAFDNRGSVDSIDFPHVVTLGITGQPQKSVGGSLRQSIFGLEAFGPEVAGAKSRAEIQFDFAGGFSTVPNGVNFGIVRLRTATLHLDWSNTSIVAGQDNLFFAPLTPTSLASLAVPALSYAGNLWSWTPQVRIEHRINLSEDSAITLQAGVLDPVTGEFPYVNYYRYPLAGERSGIPAVASRIAYTNKSLGEPFTVGVGSYYSREDWGFGRTVDGWAGMTDISVPLGRMFSVSGEFYRGRGIGGLGAAQNRSILWSGDLSSPTSIVRGLDDMGGWAQLKFKPRTRLEFNVAAGQDSAFRNEVWSLPGQNYYTSINANRSALANFIYHPRSDLVFSAEYDRLRTSSIYDYSSANHVSLSMGILF